MAVVRMHVYVFKEGVSGHPDTDGGWLAKNGHYLVVQMALPSQASPESPSRFAQGTTPIKGA
jgi:hypothetical protein